MFKLKVLLFWAYGYLCYFFQVQTTGPKMKIGQPFMRIMFLFLPFDLSLFLVVSVIKVYFSVIVSQLFTT